MCVGLPIAAFAASESYAEEDSEESLTINQVDDLFGHVPAKRVFAKPTGDEFATISSYADDQLPGQAAAAQQAAIAAAAEHETYLATPEAESERSDSLSAFENLGRVQALSLIEAQFGDQIEGVSSTPLDTLQDDDVIKFRGEDVALVDPAGPRDKELVVSTLPMRATDSTGELAPVDTSLERHDDSWAPANPVVESSLPQSSGDPIEVADLELTVPDEQDAESSSLALGDSARFYPEVGDDTDMVASSITSGIEIFFTLRSPDSPENQTMNFDLPSGADLVSKANGSITVVKDGRTLATVSPPASTDAQGTQVPAAARVEGDSIVVHTDHQGRDFAYPILVDPLVEKSTPMPNQPRPLSSVLNEQYGFMWPDGGWYQVDTGIPSERYATSGTYGGGLYLNDPATGHSSVGGMWMWMPPPGASDLTQVDFGPYNLNLNGDGNDVGGAAVMGMYNSSGTAAHTVVSQTAGGYTSLDADDVSGDPQSLDAAVFGLFRIRFGTPTHEEDHDAFLGGAVAHYTDPEGAVLYGDYGQLTEPTILNGWTKEDGEVSFPLRAADYGLGVKAMAVYLEDDEQNVTVLGSYIDPCEGTPASPCPERLDHDVTADFSQFNEGEEYTLKFRAFDPLGETNGGLDATIGIDRTAPTLDALDGDLKELEGTLSTRDDSVSLATGAADDQGVADSGLKTISFREDAYQTWGDDLDCQVEDCASAETLVPLGQLNDGPQTVTVTATDLAGNSASDAVSLALDRTAPEITLESSNRATDSWEKGPDLKFSVNVTDIPLEGGQGVESKSIEVDGSSVEPDPCETECVNQSFTVEDAGPGDHTIVITAEDHQGHTSQTTKHIKIDGQGPDLVLDGELAAGGTIGPGTKTLEFAASESSGGLSRSGTVAADVRVDGIVVGEVRHECPNGGCEIEQSISLDDEALALGTHLVTVSAFDLAGNRSSESVTVTRACNTPEPTQVTVSNPISVAAATTSAEVNHPELLAPSAPVEFDEEEFQPTLEEGDAVLMAANTAQASQFNVEANGSVVVGRGEDALCLTPTQVGTVASNASVVNEDAALYANTAPDTDTIVRPTVLGAETFSILRSQDSPEQISWNVDSASGSSLSENSDGSISLEQDAADLPVPERPMDIPPVDGQAEPLEADGAVPPGTVDAIPEAREKTLDEIAGVISGYPGESVTDDVLPTGSSALLEGAPDSGDPDTQDTIDAIATAGQAARDLKNSLKTSETTTFKNTQDSWDEEANDRAEATELASENAISTAKVETGHVFAPDARDADGDPVPLSLSAVGDTLTIAVDHRGENFSYPIAADPYVLVKHNVIEYESFPVYKVEKYVSGREPDLEKVGWWDAKHCRNVTCSPKNKPHWYGVPGGRTAYLPNGVPNGGVGPLFETVWRPVWSTRKVLDHWGQRKIVKVVSDFEWRDTGDQPESDGPAQDAADEAFFEVPGELPGQAAIDELDAVPGDLNYNPSLRGKRRIPFNWFAGINVVGFTPDAFKIERRTRSLKRVRRDQGADTAVFVPQWYVKNAGDSTPQPSDKKTPTDTGLKIGIRWGAREARHPMKVIIKPHIDRKDDLSRTDLPFHNRTDFWKQYGDMMVNYAKIAHKVRAYGFVVGTELSHVQNDSDNFDKVINRIENHYCIPPNNSWHSTAYTDWLKHKKCHLYYASNWDKVDGTPPKWWKEPRIDGIGVDYYPDRPGTASIKNMHDRIKNLHEAPGMELKKIFLSEAGATREHDPGTSLSQKAWYEKVFQLGLATSHNSWFSGIWWWDHYTRESGGWGVDHDDYTPKEPAEHLMCSYQCRD